MAGGSGIASIDEQAVDSAHAHTIAPQVVERRLDRTTVNRTGAGAPGGIDRSTRDDDRPARP
jgi:hypothetical protein